MPARIVRRRRNDRRRRRRRGNRDEVLEAGVGERLEGDHLDVGVAAEGVGVLVDEKARRVSVRARVRVAGEGGQWPFQIVLQFHFHGGV